jgi:mannose-1-phosphate guanylyltransferase/mannose-6-phosphate isomerase
MTIMHIADTYRDPLSLTASMELKVHPIILAGGTGTRLWPMSREQHPKQLIGLLESDSLLQATATRLGSLETPLPLVERIVVVTNDAYRFACVEQIGAVGKHCKLILEPAGRGTAPAVTAAALSIVANDGDGVMVVSPADHAVSNVKAFHAQVGRGLQQVIADYAADEPRAHFFEEGILVMHASEWLAALQATYPAVYHACREAYYGGDHEGSIVRLERAAFDGVPLSAIGDVVAACSNGDANTSASAPAWSDMDSWCTISQIAPIDVAGNGGRGRVMFEDAESTFAYSEGRLIACVGTRDLVVVETPDAVLVADKGRASDVEKIVDRLRAEGGSEAYNHRKVERPWGYYDSVALGQSFQVKRIVVKPGGQLSLQKHQYRSEHWIVVSGTALVTCGDKEFEVSENESTYIPAGAVHRLKNLGDTLVELVEVQYGSYLGEDDIVRLEDTYGRQ